MKRKHGTDDKTGDACVSVQGRHLNLVLSEADFSVSIGNDDCRVTSMSSTQLTCKPSFDSVADINGDGSRPVVTVRVSYIVLLIRFVTNCSLRLQCFSPVGWL